MKRKAFYALLAALISIGLWIYVVTVVNPEWEETFYDVTVQIDETILHDKGLMLLSDTKPTVTLRLSGNRTDMVKLNSGNIVVKADLSKINRPGNQQLSYYIDRYPEGVPNNAFEIVSQTPQQIMLPVAERGFQEVKVEPIPSGKVPEGYEVLWEEATLNYEKITVYGPADVVKNIVTAKVNVNVEGQTDTISQKFGYILCDKDGNPVESKWIKPQEGQEQVEYTLPIKPKKTVSVELDVEFGGGLTAGNSKLTPYLDDKVLETIEVVGNENLLNKLESLKVGPIRLKEVPEDTELVFPVTLPEGITTITGESTIEVIVKIDIPNDLQTKKFTVRNIECINLSSGMKATVANRELTVSVRGPAEKIEKLRSEDLKVHVEMTGATVGTAYYKAIVVVINPQFESVVGEYGAAKNIEVTVTNG
ncbi:MAG: hypothetical protein E7462_05595 [Ruminococcaceae bacterium]|nr:hypothetical protein [Oscillospiraceae bacterium]